MNDNMGKLPDKSPSETGFNVNKNAFADIPEVVNETPPQQKIIEEIFEWLDVLVTAIISVVIIFSLIFRVATIEGRSMLDTLHDGEKVIITNLGYTPKQGDIVVVSRNIDNSVQSENRSSLPIIKRVIAVGGQTVDIDFEAGIVYVDGVPLKENYIRTPTYKPGYPTIEFPVYVKEGYVFVMGDNRGDSLDSRSPTIGEEGIIDVRYILGHAVLRVFPFDKIGWLG